MALDTNVYSLLEWRVAIKAESTIGTANVATMQLLNIDSFLQKPDGTTYISDVRSGAGNTKKLSDVRVITKGVAKRFSIAGTGDKTSMKILMSNAMTIAVSSSPASFDIPFAYKAAAIVHGAAGSALLTLTVANISPEAGKTEIYKGCVVEKLTITLDDSVEGGLLKFTADLMTQYAITEDQATPSTMTAYPATPYFLCDMNTTREIGGAVVLINKFELVVESPVVALGSQGASCDPQQYQKGQPAPIITGVIGVKVDANSTPFPAEHRAKTTQTFEFSNNATWASATGLGVKGDFGLFTNVPQMTDVDAGAYVDIAFELHDGGSGDIVQVIL